MGPHVEVKTIRGGVPNKRGVKYRGSRKGGSKRVQGTRIHYSTLEQARKHSSLLEYTRIHSNMFEFIRVYSNSSEFFLISVINSIFFVLLFVNFFRKCSKTIREGVLIAEGGAAHFLDKTIKGGGYS